MKCTSLERQARDATAVTAPTQFGEPRLQTYAYRQRGAVDLSRRGHGSLFQFHDSFVQQATLFLGS